MRAVFCQSFRFEFIAQQHDLGSFHIQAWHESSDNEAISGGTITRRVALRYQSLHRLILDRFRARERGTIFGLHAMLTILNRNVRTLR
jgi:hypothetical protein